MAKEKMILGQSAILKATDFEFEKLSNKYGKLYFKLFKKSPRDEKREESLSNVNHIKVLVTTEDGLDLSIKIPMTDENQMKLEKAKLFDLVDFEDVLLGFYGAGEFSIITPTIKANKLVIVNQNNQPTK